MPLLLELSVLLFQIHFITASSTECLGTCRESLMRYARIACSDRANNAVFNGLLTAKIIQTSEHRCAFACHQNIFCLHAIYREYNYPSCRLVSALGSASKKSWRPKGRCFVLSMHRPMRCLKCGQPQEFFCSCPEPFYGQHCEQVKPASCQSSSWVNVTGSSTTTLVRTQEALKMSVSPYTPSTILPHTSIYRLSSFQTLNESDRALATGFLSVDFTSGTFMMPARFEFKYFINASAVRTYVVALEGTPIESNYEAEETMIMLAREGFDSFPVTYDAQYQTGSIYDVSNGLEQGHRLLSRAPTRVGYDQFEGEAYFEFLTSRMGTDGETLSTPLYFSTSKQQSRGVFTAQYHVGRGTGVFLDPSMSTHLWQMDTCWYPVEKKLGQIAGVEIIRDAVSNGNEIRVLLDSFVSSDIIEVAMTGGDFAVSLAPYLTPFDSGNDFSENSTLTYSAISDSKTISTCRTGFHGSKSSKVDTDQYNETVTWVLGIRSWTLVFRIDSGSVVFEGTKENVTDYSAKGHDVRVCVEYSQSLTVCYASDVVHLMSYSHVLVQTLPAVDMIFDANGEFQEIADSNTGCKLHRYLISTKGFVKSIRYIVGDTTVENDDHVQFNFLSWFVAI